jgi:spoIIIJ-associated protein
VEATVTRETEKRAPSVEEAVEAALHELGVSEQEAQIDVIQEPRTGVLGIGSHEAVVRVRVVTPDVDPEELEEQADTAADFLEELMGHMGIDAVAEPNLHHDHMYVDIVGEDEDDMALLIGRHGQTLDAIQELTRMVVGRRLDERVRVIVDVEDYRKRREIRLEEKAREAAERVLRGGTEEALEPMNPFERKLVHDAVAMIDGVESSSRGEEPERYVVIRRRR